MGEAGKGNGCSDACEGACGLKEVPSPEEKACLDALRAIKERVRELKMRIRDVREGEGDASGGKADLEREMKRLHEEWEAWEARRVEAARKRMIHLGHEEPD